MAEYSKKTVAELQEILKSRNLASSGKKADLVARLTEADRTAENTNTAEPEAATDTVAVPPQADSALAEQPVNQDAPTDQAQPEAIDAATNDAPAPTVEEKNYSINLAASEVDNEMAKRKARAERFGTGGQANADSEVTETASADTDALKALERAKRFGAGETAIGKLDEALSSERGPRGRKRGAGPVDENSTMDDPGLKRNFNRKGGFANRKRGGPGKPTGIGKPSGTPGGNDRDRHAAEARKKRFAAQS